MPGGRHPPSSPSFLDPGLRLTFMFRWPPLLSVQLFVSLAYSLVCLPFLKFFYLPIPFRHTREACLITLWRGIIWGGHILFLFFLFWTRKPSVSLLPASSSITILSQFTLGKNRCLLLCQKYNIQEKTWNRKNESILTVYRLRPNCEPAPLPDHHYWN